MRLTLVALVLLAVVGCAPNFHSVKATAALGGKLGDFSDALDYLPRRCANLGPLAKPCGPLAAAAPKWHRPPSVLADYAAGLGRLAGGENKDIDDQVSDAATAGAALAGRDLDDQVSDAVGVAVQSLVGLIARGWRARELGKVVAEAAPHVDAVAAALDGEIALQRRILSALDAWMGSIEELTGDVGARVDGRKKELSPTGREQAELVGETGLGTRAALAFLRVDLRDQDARLQRYSKALRSFAEAHRRLAKAGKLDDDGIDRDLLAAILEATKKIAAANEELMSTKGSDGDGR